MMLARISCLFSTLPPSSSAIEEGKIITVKNELAVKVDETQSAEKALVAEENGS